MSVRRPITRYDGTPGWLDPATGQIFTSLAEAAGLWSLDDGLKGLMAEAEVTGEAGAGERSEAPGSPHHHHGTVTPGRHPGSGQD